MVLLASKQYMQSVGVRIIVICLAKLMSTFINK